MLHIKVAAYLRFISIICTFHSDNLVTGVKREGKCRFLALVSYFTLHKRFTSTKLHTFRRSIIIQNFKAFMKYILVVSKKRIDTNILHVLVHFSYTIDLDYIAFGNQLLLGRLLVADYTSQYIYV
jgi:hypothetical protein